MEDKSNSADTAVVASTENTPTLVKKPAKSKAKVQRTKSTHPPTSEMVTTAIKELKDRKGSSLQAIKKYIVTTYKVDGEKVAPFIRRYLKTAVTSGTVVQTKGKGASGSFKLSSSKVPENKTRNTRTTKVTRTSPETKSVEKKAVAVKKAVESKKVKPVKKSEAPKKLSPAQKKAAAKQSVAIAAEKKGAKKAVQPKTLSKTKKTAKAPAAKTKTPKPKKAAAPKVVKAPAKK